MKLTFQLLQETITAHESASMDELSQRLVHAFGPEVDDVLDQVLAMVARDINEGRDSLGVIGGALSIVLLAVAKGGAA